MNDLGKIGRIIQQKGKRLEREIKSNLPRKIGVIASNHYKDNFRKAGFVNAGLKPWKKTLRQGRAKGADGEYTPLLSRRAHLMRSIRYEPGNARVKIINDVPYARIHNEGGTVTTHPKVTPKMRRFAWAMFYQTAGISSPKKKGRDLEQLSEEAKKWRALALTKKTSLKVVSKIPRRQFIGKSQELEEKIDLKIDKEIKDILK